MSDTPHNPPGGAPPPPGGQSPPPSGGGQAPPPGGSAPPGGSPPPGGSAPPGGGQAPPPGAAPPPQGGGQPAPSQAGQPADLGTRILAKVIDSIIVGIVVAPIWIVLGIVLAFTNLPSFFTRLVTFGLATVIYLGYFGFMESNKGQTVGKMLMKLEVRAANGGKPTMEDAVKRNIYFATLLIGIIPFVGWFLYPLAWIALVVYIIVTINNNTQTRQGWHDQFAGGTWVLKTQ